MTCFQATSYKPHIGLTVNRPDTRVGRTCISLSLPRRFLCIYASGLHKLQLCDVHPRLVLDASNHKRLAPTCATTRKGNYGTENDPFSMESLKKAMDGVNHKRSIQDVLREQIAHIREQGSGGNGGNKNRPGGGGGSSGGPEDEAFNQMMDEVVQVVLATVAFILVYIHIIRGEELYRLARDYIRYLFGGKSTARLRRAMYKWQNFSENMVKKEMEEEDDRLERSTVAKPTWWQQPQRLARLMEEIYSGYRRPHAQET